MPHHGFFAVRSDARPIFEFVLSNTECEVLESYSVPDRPLRRFTSVEEIGQAVDTAPYHLGFMLYAPTMRGRYTIEHIKLLPNAIPGKSTREHVQGWGLIQIELDFTNDKIGRLRESFTNHNSRQRAMTWSDTYVDLPSVDDWDFRVVSSISGKINRYIRNKLSVQRLGSRSVLPGAQAAARNGTLLLPD